MPKKVNWDNASINYGAYGRYAGYAPTYGGYDFILKSMSDQNRGALARKIDETKVVTEPSSISKGAKIGIATAIGVGLVLLAKGKGKQALDIIKKPFQSGKLGELVSKVVKKAPETVTKVV